MRSCFMALNRMRWARLTKSNQPKPPLLGAPIFQDKHPIKGFPAAVILRTIFGVYSDLAYRALRACTLRAFRNG